MASQTLFSLSGVVGVGPIVSFPQSDNIRVFQVNPRVGVGFSGAVDIEESYAASPGGSDFQRLASINFTSHKSNFALEVASDAPWIRVKLTTSNGGEVALFGTSRSGSLQGSSGAPLVSSTAVVDAVKKATVTGVNVHVKAPVVPQISSDDVAYSQDINKTVTDVLVDLTSVITPTGPSAADLAVLTGVADTACSSALTQADLCKLAEFNGSASELNHLVGVTGGIQAQLDTKATGPGVDVTGLTTPSAWINSFFDVSPTVTVSGIAINLSGLTATAADLNVLTGTVGTFTGADLDKLGDIIASAAEINSLSGFTGSSTDLNKLGGLTASTADLNQVSGLAGVGVSTSEFTYLQGLSQNVQLALNNIPALGGLTATVSDLNLLEGAATGTGAYAGAITSTEISYLDGLTSNIQAQLNTKRDISVPIGIAEISGASITTVELNYLQGATANIQAQIDALGLGSITTAGGTFIGPIYIANGSAANPGLGYAGQNTTGLYLEGVGLGVSTLGTRSFSVDATDVRFGDDTVDGQPVVKHSGMTEANPTYSFRNDEDTGVVRLAPDNVAVSAGGERMVECDATGDVVKIGGQVSTNNAVEIPGIFAGEKRLGVASVSAGATGSTGTTALYTVPAGRSAAITKILVILTNVTGFVDTTNFRMNIGFTAPNYDELVDNVTNINVFDPLGYAFDTPNQIMPLGYGDNAFPAVAGASGADYAILTAGAVLTANVSVLANANDYVFDVVVFGYEY